MPGEPTAYITLAILIAAGITSFKGFSDSAFTDRYIFDPYQILARKQYYRMLTSGFLHADLIHFGFNAYTLYSFGSGIETIPRIGPVFLLVIFFASILGGNLLSLWLHRHHEYRALGASGGVCGVIYASIFLFPGSSVRLFLMPFDIPAYLFAIVFILFSVFGMKARFDNIGHDAHLGGALVGLAITTAWFPQIITAQPVTYTLVATISLAVFIYLYITESSPRTGGSPLATLKKAFAEKKTGKRRHDDYHLQQETDRILAKIHEHGMNSLTDREIKILQNASRNKQDKP